MSDRRPPPPPAPRKLPIFWIALGGVAVIAVVVIVISVSGSGGTSNDNNGVTANGVALQQTQPVQVLGQRLPAMPSSGKDAAIGRAIPTVNGQSFDGTPVSLTNDGNGKVIVFMAHWCPHCQREIPQVASWLKANSLPANVQVYGVATSTSSSYPNYPPSAWLQQIGWMRPTIADDKNGTAGSAFGLETFPYFVVVSPAGKVVDRTAGEIAMTEFAGLVSKAAAS